MNVCVLFNPRSGSGGQIEALRGALAADRSVTFRELGPGDDVAECAARAAREGFDIVAVAGGDGTVSAAANGLIAARSGAALAVLPLGTGNDFCRTMAIPLDPFGAIALLPTAQGRRIDAVRVEGGRAEYLVNAATGGFSGKVASETTAELKAAWGPLAYLRGAVGMIADPTHYRLSIRFDGRPAERFDALNVVIANCRTAAGGILVAPAANPEDGRLDVIIVIAGDALDSSLIATRLMNGDYTHDENVIHRRARRVEIESDPPLPLSVDGELCEGSRFAFTVVPQALRVLVGPDYRPAGHIESALEDEDGAGMADVQTAPRKGMRSALFGLLGGFLLLAKRLPRDIALGLGVAAFAILLFAGLAHGVVGERWRTWDESMRAAWEPDSHPGLHTLAEALTWFGGAWGTAFAIAALLTLFIGRKHYLTAAALVGVLAGTLVLEVVLKSAFAIARPPFYPDSPPTSGSSFPSGHALRAVGIYGYLAAVALAHGFSRRRPGWWVVSALSALLAVGVCWSRVYLGVHWPTDVIAGALAATVWVAACLVARHRGAIRAHRRNVG